MTSPRPGQGRDWPLSAVLLFGATLLGLLTSVQHYAVMQLEAEDPAWRTVSHALSRELPFWFLWVALAPVVLWTVRRFRFERRRLAISLPAHLAVAAALMLAHSALLLAAHRLLPYPTPEGPFWTVYTRGLLFRVPTELLGYLVLFVAIVAWEYRVRFREREVAAADLSRQLAEARLQALRMQLNPHFLFNTMNSIAMLVRRGDSAQAVRMLAGLSELLRYVLEEKPPQEVPLRQELAFVERYLEIERARFPDRLRVTIDATPDALDALVPNLVLQPLVENALRHGVSRRATLGTIEIRAHRADGDLLLAVADDGPGLGTASRDGVTPESGIPVSSGGIGLRNTANRLAQLYGGRGRLELESPESGGVVARVRVPFRPAPAA